MMMMDTICFTSESWIIRSQNGLWKAWARTRWPNKRNQSTCDVFCVMIKKWLASSSAFYPNLGLAHPKTQRKSFESASNISWATTRSRVRPSVVRFYQISIDLLLQTIIYNHKVLKNFDVLLITHLKFLTQQSFSFIKSNNTESGNCVLWNTSNY